MSKVWVLEFLACPGLYVASSGLIVQFEHLDLAVLAAERNLMGVKPVEIEVERIEQQWRDRAIQQN